MESKLQEIKETLTGIGQRIDRALSANSLSNIEIDILLEQLRSVYVHMEMLKSYERKENSVQDKDNSIDSQANLEVQVSQTPAFDVNKVIDPQPFIPSPPPVIEEPDLTSQKVTDQPIYYTQHSNSEPQSSASHKTQKVTGDLFTNATVADKLKSDNPSLNEKITQGHDDRSLAHKMQLKPIADLKTAIGINDKFQFINDLFEGRIELYNDAINRLNSCGTAIMADVVFLGFKNDYNWNENGDAFNKLRVFVTRRYL